MKVGLGILVYETGKLHFGLFSHDHYDPISNPGLDIKEVSKLTITIVLYRYCFPILNSLNFFPQSPDIQSEFY